MAIGYDGDVGYDSNEYSYDGEFLGAPCPPAIVEGTSTGGTFTAGGDLTLAIPDGTPGNMLVVGLSVGNGALTVPAGWTSLENISHPSSSGFRAYILYRVADGSEGGSVTFTYGGRIVGALVEGSAWDTGTPFQAHGSGTGLTASPRVGSIGVGAAVLFDTGPVADFAPPAGWTELVDVHAFAAFDTGGEVAYIAPTTGTFVSESWTGDNRIVWAFLQAPDCAAPAGDVGWTLGDLPG